MGILIKEGSLVKMKNRKVKGQGIVLKRVKDINDYAEFDLQAAFKQIYDRKHKEYHFKDYKNSHSSLIFQLRADLIESINTSIVKSNSNIELSLLNEFWNYNMTYCLRSSGLLYSEIRKDFALIKWLRAPSDYTIGSYKVFETGFHWFPTHILGICKLSS